MKVNEIDIEETTNEIIEPAENATENIEPPTENAVIEPIENVNSIIEPTECDDIEFNENPLDSNEQDIIQDDRDYGASGNLNVEVNRAVLNKDLDNDDLKECKDEEEEEEEGAYEHNKDGSEASIENFENNEIFTDAFSEHEEETNEINKINDDNDEIRNIEETIHETYHETNEILADIATTVAVLSNQELFQLIESNEFELFNSAIKHVNNIDQIWNEKGYSLLHCAATQFSVQFINAISENAPRGFVNEKTRDDDKWTALHLAVVNSKEKETDEISQVFSALIQNGADIDVDSSDFNVVTGYTPLFSAIIRNNLKAMEALLIQGADANIIYEGLPLLHQSFTYCKIEGINLLLEYKADPLIINKYNRAALHEAAFKDNLEIVNLLIDEYKCDVDIRTPAKSDSNKTHKKDLRKADILYYATPLHYAIKMCCASLARQLIIKGADRNAKDSYGKTPWFYDECDIGSVIYMTI